MPITWDNLEYHVRPQEPQSVREARVLIEECRQAIKTIERQLADRNVTDKKGRRLSNTKYHRWRRNALRALSAKQVELRYYRDWLAKEMARREALKYDVTPDRCEDLLIASYNLLREWSREVEFNEAERSLMDLIRSYITGVGAIA
ncbi:MAG: hypothetical protein D6746_17625 [Bacteroidetes bacterium]|nr:MAG: hypothetical protein D6746_17625 [Bacteroidota bacterium]